MYPKIATPTQHRAITAPTETNISSPNPVSGERIPPKVKKLKPSIAEALTKAKYR